MSDENLEIISRQEAKEKGLKFYFTGKPCKHGHTCKRFVKNAGCYECAREQDRRRNNKRSEELHKKKEYEERRIYTLYGYAIITREEAKEQGLDRYFTGVPCEQGHFSERSVATGSCLECLREASKIHYETYKERYAKRNKRYYEENKEWYHEYYRQYREENMELVRVRGKKYREENVEKERMRHKKYREENKDKINAYFRERSANDPTYSIKKNLSGRIRTALKTQNKSKDSKTVELLGCTIEECKQHLEDQFQEGMTWDNYGEWEIDHIRPCASFDLTDVEQQKECFYWANLQPLWKLDNDRKDSWYNGKRYIKGEVAS